MLCVSISKLDCSGRGKVSCENSYLEGFENVAYVSTFGMGNRKLLIGTSITRRVSPTSGSEDKVSVKSWAMLDLNGVGEQGQ